MPVVAVGLAVLILVPTTFAVGEPGTTLFAQLGPNRFPAGQGSADASLAFNSHNDIVLRIAITGPPGTVNAVRVYVDGTCTNPGEWVINRTPTAGPDGPFLTVNSNTGVNTIQVNQLDVNRIRSELAENPNETFALMVARFINGQNYRTCTAFRSTPFPPLTTTTATTAPTTTTSATTSNTTRFTTRTVTTTIGSQTFTLTLTQPVTTTVLSTGTNTQTVTSTASSVTTVPTITTVTSTGFSTGFTGGSFTTINGTTITLIPPAPITSVPVTTVTTTVTGSQTLTVPVTTLTTTVTSTFTTPVTTVTITL
jgi:hypothetical protein